MSAETVLKECLISLLHFTYYINILHITFTFIGSTNICYKYSNIQDKQIYIQDKYSHVWDKPTHLEKISSHMTNPVTVIFNSLICQKNSEKKRKIIIFTKNSVIFSKILSLQICDVQVKLKQRTNRGKSGCHHIFVNPELTLKPCLVVTQQNHCTPYQVW